MQEIEQKVAFLDKFLADNPQLEELSARLSQFNIFRTLKIEQAEIRHSNVLSWLLDPEESHGLSDIVLRRLLSNILLLSDKTIPGLSAAKVELLDFSDVEVVREWRGIDILVIDRHNKLVLFFENKVNSGESKGQLARYLKIIKEEFCDYALVPVFLTLTGQESSDDKVLDYVCYSHTDLLSALEKIYGYRKSQITGSVQLFLEDYLDTLRRLTMQESELTQLCKSIYRKHREAVDLIVEHGKISTGQQAVEDLLTEVGGHEILYSSPAYVWFLPESWGKIVPENSLVWSHLKRPVSITCRIEFWKDRMVVYFEFCKMDDPELRLECVEQLSKADFSLSSKAFNKTATYSRFFNTKIKVDDMSDYEQTYKAAEKLLNKAKEKYPIAEAVFSKVFSKKKKA